MSEITLTRLPGYDINGNPRYVCHYLNLLTEKEKSDPDNVWRIYNGVTQGYQIAIFRARKIGGRKYHTKHYGGGIVFRDYPAVIMAAIKDLVEKAEKEEAQP